ncbi:MAG: SMP-30/gluconolactonase/LRE family protein [Rhodothermales bacterium]
MILLRHSLLLLVLLAGCKSTEPPHIGEIVPHESRFEALIPKGAFVEKLAEGFEWSEGPVWVPAGQYLLFSDIPVNTIYRWDAGRGLHPYLRPAGYAWNDAPGLELGTNGLVLDSEGRLVMCDHGNRQIARLDTTNYTKETLASSYNGKRFNSPNDLIYKSNGDLYFTDPPYGLRGLNEDPAKELPFNGVYRLRPSGEVTLLTRELSFPNGIAFSPDESTLYVANSDPQRPIWMAFDVLEDGTLTNGRVFFDASELVARGLRGLPDGLKVDRQGNLFATGPGGVVVLSPEGTHLGTIATGELAANCAFGDDGSSLYITSDRLLARIRLNTMGLGF